MLPTTAFSAALSAMTAQHYGAGLMNRARHCMRPVSYTHLENSVKGAKALLLELGFRGEQLV